MNWNKDISSNEILFILIFSVLYLIYIIRIAIISRKLKTTFRSIVIKLILRVIYFSLLIFSLLGPSFGITEQEAKNTSKDIYLVMDLSKSMDADDVLPSRLEKVKSELYNFIIQQKANKIGIIVFTNEAFVYTPLTFDTEALRQAIYNLNTNLLNETGTDFNAPLGLLLEKSNNQIKSNKSEIAVLITDGENFGDLDQSLLKKLKNNNLGLYFMGIGTAEGGKIPENNTYKKDKNGNEVISTLNVDLLREIASTQGKILYSINNKNNDFEKLNLSINNTQQRFNDNGNNFATNNKYQYFLFLVVLLVCIDFLFSVKIISI